MHFLFTSCHWRAIGPPVCPCSQLLGNSVVHGTQVSGTGESKHSPVAPDVQATGGVAVSYQPVKNKKRGKVPSKLPSFSLPRSGCLIVFASSGGRGRSLRSENWRGVVPVASRVLGRTLELRSRLAPSQKESAYVYFHCSMSSAEPE